MGQDVCKAVKTANKRRKEGGKQAEYFSASPKEREAKEEEAGRAV